MGIPKRGWVVAIDGPAGTGKSSATKRLCDALGFTHIDTGALYRAIALDLLSHHKGKGPGSESALSEESAVRSAKSSHLEFKRDLAKNPTNRIYLNSKDITDYIRTPEISSLASKISAFPGVRSSLLSLQRWMGCEGQTILEGRDIGTVIFPDADVKFFLTASIEERAKRRLAEFEALGVDAPSFEEVKAQIIERDQRDSNRAVAPLKKADDAIEIDTSGMTLDQVVQKMAEIVQTKIRQKNV